MSTTTTTSSAETRSRIVHAAFEEFYRHGFQGGSLNHIVETAGSTKGALFHHFQGKRELGYAVLEEVIRPELKRRWFDPMTRSVDPLTDLRQTMEQVAKDDMGKRLLQHGCPLNNLAQEMAPLDETFRLHIEKIYAEWREAIECALARGIKSGNVRNTVNSKNVAAFVVATLEGLIGAAKNAQSADLLHQAAAAFFEYLESLRP